MTSPPEPSPAPDTATLAAQVATLRGQVAALKTRLDHDVIGKHLVILAEIKRLRSQVTELAQAVTETRDGDRRRGQAAPYWVGLSPQDRTYGSSRPSLDRALEFHDRWLPGTMRRIADITRRCNPECAARQRAVNTAHRFTPPNWQPPPAWGKDPRP